MLRAYDTFGESMVLQIADNLALGFDWRLDKVLIKDVRIATVTIFF